MFVCLIEIRRYEELTDIMMEQDKVSSHRAQLCPSFENAVPIVKHIHEEINTKDEPQEILISDIAPTAETLSGSTQFVSKPGFVKEETDIKEESDTFFVTEITCSAVADGLPSTEFVACQSSILKGENNIKEESDTWPITEDVCSLVSSKQKQIKEEQEDESSAVPRDLASCEEQSLKEVNDSWSETDCFKSPKELLENQERPKKKPKCRQKSHLTGKVQKAQRLPASEPEQFYKCEICDKVIRHLQNFREHQRIHTGERPFECKVCKKTFTRTGDLIKHKLVHSNKRPHKCKTCGKKFKLAGHLSKHSQVHSDLFPFKCEFCEKNFKRTACLVKHLRIHTEEKPFSCSICGKRFKWEASVREHRRIHSGEKPFRCPDCDRSFTHFSTFVQHKRIHQDIAFTCDFCERPFKHKSNLLKHKRAVHS